ncbi:MAG TPA: type II toxin-antitoxin system HicB family antitoxin [Chthoniobacterales bacterium]|nr:type II toxin-antitoxin system HicB family antitoxin [Chthoniobacterales bacterium]
MKFLTTLERDEDGVWIAECPSIPGCVSQGYQREEALKNIREAIELCLEVRAEYGMPLTIETQNLFSQSTETAMGFVTSGLESSGMPYTFRALRFEAPCPSSASATLKTGSQQVEVLV